MSAPKPYITISLIDICNMKCVYCPPLGENYHTPHQFFAPQKVKHVLETAVSLGMEKVRFTGGEPLLYPYLDEVTTYAAELGLTVHINTNGLNLSRHLRWMRHVENLVVKVSLDAVDEEVFREMSGARGVERVLAGIRQGAELGVVKRINFVLTRLNADQIPGVLALCREVGIGLKIFDMYPVPETELHWQLVYMPPDALPVEGRAAAPYGYTSRFGTPTRELVVDGVPVRIKNCFDGTRYHNRCQECAAYPCPEGLYCLVVTPSQRVVPCRLGDHLQQDFVDKAGLRAALLEACQLYDESFYVNAYGEAHQDFYAQALAQPVDMISREQLIETVSIGRSNGRFAHVVGC
jgi:MoaA/NifB/PqqE/SkfB family radical SAM enzyme